MNIKKNAIKRWGHRACLRVSRLLNGGIFTGWALKIRIPSPPPPLLTELSLCYLKQKKFYLEHKPSFIQISSIAPFNSFLVAWLWGCCTFWDSSVVSLKSSPWAKYTKYGTIFPKKIMFYYQTFFLFQICSLLDCS